jgi:energy-coupling factor transport system ATP-binding protein
MSFDGHRVGRDSKRPFKGVQMIFQNPENTFVAPTLEEDVAFALENLKVEPAEIRRRVDHALEMVGLGEYARQHPASLSGGQQQLAALAGAMVSRPDVLIMDEATSYLDDTHRQLVLGLLQRMREASGPTVIVITQEVEEMWLGDRLLVLVEGESAYDGHPEELLSNPEECRRLRIGADPMAELAACLQKHGFPVPGGRPTIDSLEKWLADRS